MPRAGSKGRQLYRLNVLVVLTAILMVACGLLIGSFLLLVALQGCPAIPSPLRLITWSPDQPSLLGPLLGQLGPWLPLCPVVSSRTARRASMSLYLRAPSPPAWPRSRHYPFPLSQGARWPIQSSPRGYIVMSPRGFALCSLGSF